MNLNASEFYGYGVVLFSMFLLLAIYILYYMYEKNRFKKWQFKTIGVSSKARYNALKDTKSILPIRKK